MKPTKLYNFSLTVTTRRLKQSRRSTVEIAPSKNGEKLGEFRSPPSLFFIFGPARFLAGHLDERRKHKKAKSGLEIPPKRDATTWRLTDCRPSQRQQHDDVALIELHSRRITIKRCFWRCLFLILAARVVKIWNKNHEFWFVFYFFRSPTCCLGHNLHLH
jgi:hypothetical protein